MDGVTGAGAALVAATCLDGLQVQSAAQDAEHLCDRVYGEAPEVRIESSREHTINYMQQHVYFVVLSLSLLPHSAVSYISQVLRTSQKCDASVHRGKPEHGAGYSGHGTATKVLQPTDWMAAS